MQFMPILFTAVFIAATATGCAFLTPERVAAIHRTAATALQLAYETGGKTLLETKINEMVADGKVTPEQGGGPERLRSHFSPNSTNSRKRPNNLNAHVCAVRPTRGFFFFRRISGVLPGAA